MCMARLIYNPPIPYVGPIPGGCIPGSMIRFRGSVPYNTNRFSINLKCGPNTQDDIALHIDFRFPEQCVVRNHLQANSWGAEERAGGIPLQKGSSFDILVLCEVSILKVAVNGVHFCQFNHRLPYQRISHVAVQKDVHIHSISFEGQSAPQQAGYVGMQPTTYNNYGVGASAPLYSQQPVPTAMHAPSGMMPPGRGGGSGAVWVDSVAGQLPPGAVVGGQDGGEAMYVARARHEGALIPGKLLPSHGVAYVPWGGAEHGKYQYQVLCGGNANWVRASGANIPPGAFPGGQSEDGETLFVGRVSHKGTVTVGKVQPSHGVCYIPYGGQELGFPGYEVLVLY